ncbi:MAG TPA: hypothetical protein VHC40_08775 [Rhizomicrobium sp.]|jgi:hypothetical protein|nr:hypothetical protein [Rhizomicrobium sp.]
MVEAVESELRRRMAADAPPARDLSFELAVMARIERRHFRRAVAGNAAVAALAALVLFMAAPPLAQAAESLNGNLIATLVAVGLGILAMQWALQREEA